MESVDNKKKIKKILALYQKERDTRKDIIHVISIWKVIWWSIFDKNRLAYFAINLIKGYATVFAWSMACNDSDEIIKETLINYEPPQ